MEAPEVEARLTALEERIARLERNIFVFQAMVAKKLTEALGLLRSRQEAREKKVQDSLQKLAGELSGIRERLESLKRPKATH